MKYFWILLRNQGAQPFESYFINWFYEVTLRSTRILVSQQNFKIFHRSVNLLSYYIVLNDQVFPKISVMSSEHLKHTCFELPFLCKFCKNIFVQIRSKLLCQSCCLNATFNLPFWLPLFLGLNFEVKIHKIRWLNDVVI